MPNDKLLEVVPNLPLQAAFKVADAVLTHAVKGITELVTKSGLVNLDFADVKTIMSNGGVAMIGLGEAKGDDAAIKSVRDALESPLLDVDISGAKAAIVNVVGGENMTISEAENVVEEVYNAIDPEAQAHMGRVSRPGPRGRHQDHGHHHGRVVYPDIRQAAGRAAAGTDADQQAKGVKLAEIRP